MARSLPRRKRLSDEQEAGVPRGDKSSRSSKEKPQAGHPEQGGEKRRVLSRIGVPERGDP